jgi:hypothetical protein
MEPTMKPIWVMIMFIWIVCLQYEIIVHREQIISLQTDNATQAQRIKHLEKNAEQPYLDHARIESNVNLIGGSVFENWETASERYSKRGK